MRGILFGGNRSRACNFCITNALNVNPENIETAIWSFAEVNNGPQKLNFIDIEDNEVEDSIRNLIAEILNPEVPFEEREKVIRKITF